MGRGKKFTRKQLTLHQLEDHIKKEYSRIIESQNIVSPFRKGAIFSWLNINVSGFRYSNTPTLSYGNIDEHGVDIYICEEIRGSLVGVLGTNCIYSKIGRFDFD
jgi:hypothetical protein